MGHCARVDSHCGRCDIPLPFDFTMAFQPIVDIESTRIVTYEVLVRGPGGESAYSVISKVTDDLIYRFDQACRSKPIELASRRWSGSSCRPGCNGCPAASATPSESSEPPR